MKSLQARIEALEQTPAARIAHAKATGDYSQLSDAEFLTICEDSRREYPEFYALIDSASKEDLDALRREDFAAIENAELREWLQASAQGHRSAQIED